MNILYYIKKFFNILRTQGVIASLCKAILFITTAIYWRCHLTPSPQKISLLRMLSSEKISAQKKASAIIGNYIGQTSYSFDRYYQIIVGHGQNFTSCEVVLIAHWDPDNTVDPYVQYMARHFKKIGKKVVLCSACDVDDLSKKLTCFDAIVSRTCPGYDFASWKAGLEAFPSLYDASELTLCNDSVFSPIGSYEPVYNAMSTVDCDCWGITFSREAVPHIQSFFIVFRKKALVHASFKIFINSIPACNDRSVAIGFELRLAIWLEMHNLTIGCYRPYTSYKNPMHFWQIIIKDKIPFIKKELFKTGGNITPLSGWQYTTDKYNYPYKIILSYFFRIGIDISPALCTGRRSHQWPPSVFSKQMDIILPTSISTVNHLKVATLLHCFYPEILKGKLLQYISYLPKYTHLYISTDTEEKANIIKSITERLSLFKIETRVLPNKGWDIAPFLVGFSDVIKKYDIICKIHAKGSTNLEPHIVDEWRHLLFDSLLGSKDHIIKILALFNSDIKLGLLAPPSLPIVRADIGTNEKIFYNITEQLHIDISKLEAIDFPVGSMFWARSTALMPLLDLNLTFNDFEYTNSNSRDGSLAHALERCFILSCCKSGFEWGRVPPVPYSRMSKPSTLPVADPKIFPKY